MTLNPRKQDVKGHKSIKTKKGHLLPRRPFLIIFCVTIVLFHLPNRPIHPHHHPNAGLRQIGQVQILGVEHIIDVGIEVDVAQLVVQPCI